ncbi:ubiquitin-binding serine/threonine protein kinase VPS15 KNAG_0J02520 [Huiozyma naganishii CBS 8797]|uniref:non-specific serine/threonine protein kinase n=1 Tax=Huiozyma naganishii (strain ATCC MYA-139 / BCRC 22969 / CBS 8797 / KCTC 17520 / NBRC 10181 / NCYC 3082 / Yp74L-3) TaxID=1071383 RepID=J7SAN6_HUIN7|nr:hypothetical protein KNAG_0J02520 [Kazachstania naganishii CBS 8797]CCK72331.1 hypothetical protein KNAG_0J02520 [Kazachstania naganishii CBS 8797]
MGAKLSLLAQTAPSIGIFSYVDVLNEIHYVSQLNSSKFLKTCKGIDPNGPVVIKVFIKPQENYTVSAELDKIRKESLLLSQLPSVLNFSKIIETSRAAYLVRQYMRDNLYDRISSRPYLHQVEKLFIAFQILTALQEIHKLDVTHGDLKLENILPNTWNWISIADFSSCYKPVYLPEDNPGEFTFYFDTSKRRCCYLAPERFSSQRATSEKEYSVTKEMDIFSAGCCIAELFNDGIGLFNLSDIFKYKNGELDADALLCDLFPEQEPLRQLILDMIDLDPNNRLACSQLLSKYRGSLFPNHFYTFTYEFLKNLAILSTNVAGTGNIVFNKTLEDMSSVTDECVDKFYVDFEKICTSLEFPLTKLEQRGGKQYSFKLSHSKAYALQSFSKLQDITTIREECALLFTSYLSHAIRNTLSSNTRLKCLELLTIFSQYVSDENKLDRIIPFVVMNFDHIDDENVQSLSVQCLCQILSLVEAVSPLNENIFVDYLMPRLKRLLQSSEEKSYVRVVFANCLGDLVTTACKFQELSFASKEIQQKIPSSADQLAQGLAVMEITNHYTRKLLQQVEDLTIRLLTSNDVWVKVALLRNILPLCNFFGKEMTNDVILSHLITYFNDRDFFLRMTLVDVIPGIAILLGPIALEQYILPLLIQTLTDSEEWVIVTVLQAVEDLAKIGILSKRILYDTVANVAPLLLHPNHSIHQFSLRIVFEITQQMSDAEIYCGLYPIIRPFFGFDIDFDLETLIETCKQPVSRIIYNLLCSWSLRASNSLFWQQVPNEHIDSFGNNAISFVTKDYIPRNYGLVNGKDKFNKKEMILLKNSKDIVESFDKKQIPLTIEDKLWIDKFKTIGLRDSDLWKLEVLREYVTRSTKSSGHKTSKPLFNNSSVRRNYEITTELSNVMPRNVFFDIEFYGDEILNGVETESTQSVEEESRFKANLSKRLLTRERLGSIVDMHGSLVLKSANATGFATQDTQNVNVRSKSTITPSETSKSKSLRSLDSSKRYLVKNSYEGKEKTVLQFLNKFEISPSLRDLKEFGFITFAETELNTLRDIKGMLIASLVGDKKIPVISLNISLKDKPYLVGGSIQGDICIWDMEHVVKGRRLKFSSTYECNATITHMELIPGFDTLAVSTKNGKMVFLRILHKDRKDGKRSYSFERIRELDLNKKSANATTIDEYIVNFKTFNNEDRSHLVGLTKSGLIIIIDICSMSILRYIDNPVTHGAVSCFDVDTDNDTLIVGTVKGIIDVWDLRFKVLVESFTFGDSTPIKSIITRRSYHDNTVVITGGSSAALCTVWDYSKLQCKMAIVLSDEQPSISAFVANVNNLESSGINLKMKQDVNNQEISSIAVKGSSIVISKLETSDLIICDMETHSNSKAIAGPNAAYYSFVPVQATAALSFILIKPMTRKPILTKQKNAVTLSVIGQLGQTPLVITSNVQGTINVFK